MVVEGHNDTLLAVECDGDQFHGLDRWEDDMHRQRILERVGWRFWRCFASDFVRNRQEVIDDLMQALEERGISPIGKGGTPNSFHTEQRRVVAFETSDPTNGFGECSEPIEQGCNLIPIEMTPIHILESK